MKRLGRSRRRESEKRLRTRKEKYGKWQNREGCGDGGVGEVEGGWVEAARGAVKVEGDKPPLLVAFGGKGPGSNCNNKRR